MTIESSLPSFVWICRACLSVRLLNESGKAGRLYRFDSHSVSVRTLSSGSSSWSGVSPISNARSRKCLSATERHKALVVTLGMLNCRGFFAFQIALFTLFCSTPTIISNVGSRSRLAFVRSQECETTINREPAGKLANPRAGWSSIETSDPCRQPCALIDSRPGKLSTRSWARLGEACHRLHLAHSGPVP